GPTHLRNRRRRTDQLLADAPVEHHRALAQADRAKALEDVAIYERMMREQPQEYWKLHNQKGYRDAIQRSLVEAPDAAPGTFPSIDTAPSSPAAPAAAVPTLAATPPGSPPRRHGRESDTVATMERR